MADDRKNPKGGGPHRNELAQFMRRMVTELEEQRKTQKLEKPEPPDKETAEEEKKKRISAMLRLGL